MNHGSLFSGIGGFELAAQWMGWQNKFHCEWNEFGRKILNYYWPQAESYGDITTTDFTIHAGKIDILTGGFPCQPYSQAGKRSGNQDERHLWPEMLRAVKEVEPRWVVGENVYGIVNWNEGLVFEQVQADLENEGYTVQPYILPAAGVNAPHQRYRIWFVGYSEINHQRAGLCQNGKEGVRRGRFGNPASQKTSPNSPKIRMEGNGPAGEQEPQTPPRPELSRRDDAGSYWKEFPTQSPVCSRDDGIPGGLDGITFPKWRNESIKGYGNAIVPQVALQIFKAIEEHEKSTNL